MNGLGNFRFCVANAKPYIPFFPVAYAPSALIATNVAATTTKKESHDMDESGGPATTMIWNEKDQTIRFAIGLENGSLAHKLLSGCKSLHNLKGTFRVQLADTIRPVQTICRAVVAAQNKNTRKRGRDNDDYIAGGSNNNNDNAGTSNNDSSNIGNEQNISTVMEFVGIDTSLNPSLDPTGSVAAALEVLPQVKRFGGPGTLASAAAVTRCLQSLPDIQLTGYCGLMLPLCEDARLVDLATTTTTAVAANGFALRTLDLLNVSHVCGVGLDTVPLPGDTGVDDLTSLLLDVAGVAERWGKSLSCRVFPVPGKQAGEMTSFESPHMMNCRILPLSQSQEEDWLRHCQSSR